MKSKISTFVVLFLLVASSSLVAQNNNSDFFKRAISKKIQKAKSLENRDAKEVKFEKLVAKINKSIDRLDQEKVSEENLQELLAFQTRMNDGLKSVQGKSHQDLNEFGDFLESETNQAWYYYLVLAGGLIYSLIAWVL